MAQLFTPLANFMDRTGLTEPFYTVTMEWIPGAVGAAMNFVEDTWDKIPGMFQRMGDNYRGGYELVSTPIKKAAKAAGEFLGEGFSCLAEDIQIAAGQAKDKTQATMEKAKETASDTLDKLKETAGNAAETVKETADKAAETVKQTAAQVADTVTDTARTAADKVVDTGKKIIDGIGRLFGKR